MKLLFSLLFISFSLTNYAQPKTGSADSTAIPAAIKSVTKHSAVINGKPISYTATAGALLLKNEKDETVALFGYTAYTKDGETDASKRPVTFAYNGGPGSASMWLHMGILGPKRVVVNDPENTPPPPYKSEDNPNSIIDITDLVMIDPIGTGISHAVGKSKNKDFWGVDQDIKSVSKFIYQYTNDNDRWNSPKFLLGESYGTTRSGGVVNALENMGLTMNGVILVSVVLDYRTLTFQPADDLPYTVYIPGYAATAWYHNKISNKPASLETFLKDARDFALGEYTHALLKGSNLSDAEKESVATKLSAFTGLNKDYLLKAKLRVSPSQFREELLRNEHKVVGRLDSRYKGVSQDLLSEDAEYDPQSTAITGAYTSVFLNYYYNELKVDKNYNYHTSARDGGDFEWDWKHAKSSNARRMAAPPHTGIDLAETMSQNPNLKLLVLNGYYDLATPFFATEYTLDHLGLEPEIRKNVTFKYYPAGHMMYIEPASAGTFKKDVAEFIGMATKR
ncbi:MAG: S10 family peptidase [Sphingobacteriales bacterium]